jgi:hypothetical protein
MAQFRINLSSFQPLRFSEEMSREDMSRWANLFSIPIPGDQTPGILVNPLPQGVGALAAIMNASDQMEPIWKPLTIEELYEAESYFHADLSVHGNFDPTTTSVVDIAQSLCENRRITVTELILTMCCPYLAKHRTYALSIDFADLAVQRSHTYRCVKNDDCICKHLEFSRN